MWGENGPTFCALFILWDDEFVLQDPVTPANTKKRCFHRIPDDPTLPVTLFYTAPIVPHKCFKAKHIVVGGGQNDVRTEASLVCRTGRGFLADVRINVATIHAVSLMLLVVIPVLFRVVCGGCRTLTVGYRGI